MHNIKKIIRTNYVMLILGSLLLIFVAIISNMTPLAGDDWAFYNNSMNNTIINSAVSMYYNWEGRLMTLLSIHFFIMNRSLWEILNPLIYLGVFISSYMIIKPKNKFLFGTLFIFLVLTMKENVRMEVMTWITGSIYYGIPLLLSFIYSSINYKVFELKITKVHPILFIVSVLIAFYLPLGMENISIAMIIATIVLIAASYYRDKKVPLIYIANIVMFIIGYVIWMNSPGSSIRLSQMPEWNELSFIGKILQTLPNVLFYTFYQNKLIIISLGLSLAIFNFQIKKVKFSWVFGLVYLISIIIMLSQRLFISFPDNYLIGMLADPYSTFNIIFWIIYALVLVGNIVYISIVEKSTKALFFLLIAFFANASLLMSPVIGYRLMVYSIFYLIVVILIIIDKMELKFKLDYIAAFILLILSLYLANRTISKFQLVESITLEREAIISDYKIYFEFYKDGIWLPRYPIYSIHGGDIEIEDLYHMKAFKEYYDIPQEETIIFYWKESY